MLFGYGTGSIRYGKTSLMEKYFKLTGRKDDPKIGLEIQYVEYVRFLADYFKDNPLRCLEEVFEMRDFSFDELFFDSI